MRVRPEHSSADRAPNPLRAPRLSHCARELNVAHAEVPCRPGGDSYRSRDISGTAPRQKGWLDPFGPHFAISHPIPGEVMVGKRKAGRAGGVRIRGRRTPVRPLPRGHPSGRWDPAMIRRIAPRPPSPRDTPGRARVRERQRPRRFRDGASAHMGQVEMAGIEPASNGAEPGLLRVQSAVLFSAPEITPTSLRRAQSL